MAQSNPKTPVTVLALAIAFPSLVTLLYFVILGGYPPAVQQAAYATGKVLQFSLPVAWTWWWLGKRPAMRKPTLRGVGTGLVFGAAVSLAMALLYGSLLQPWGVFADAADVIRGKILGLGVDSAAKFAGLGAFYAIGHSGLEEYYWRWFVFGQLRDRCSLTSAIAISSLGFMAHHVLLLAQYFGWASVWTYFFSVSVAVGGAVWAWLYARTGSLMGPWLSHLLVDTAIFMIGYTIVRDLFV